MQHSGPSILAFIAGHSTHQYLKRRYDCMICRDLLTMDKDLLIDEPSLSQFMLLDLSYRGGLKYLSELVLESIVTAWKIFVSIENDNEMMALLVEGPSRNILVDLSMNSILDADVCDSWVNVCPFCAVNGCYILHKILFVAINYFFANKAKNYNSMVISRGMEKRKLKKIPIIRILVYQRLLYIIVTTSFCLFYLIRDSEVQ